MTPLSLYMWKVCHGDTIKYKNLSIQFVILFHIKTKWNPIILCIIHNDRAQFIYIADSYHFLLKYFRNKGIIILEF